MHKPTNPSRYGRLLGYVARQWRWCALIVVLSALSSLGAALQPWPLKLLVDCALGDEALPPVLRSAVDTLSLTPSPVTIIVLVALLGLAILVFNDLLEIGLTWSWSVAGQRMVYELTEDLFGRLQRLSLVFHSRRSVGDSLSRLGTDTWSVYSLTSGVLTPFQHIIRLVTFSAVAWQLDQRLALLTFLLAPLLGASSFYFGKRLKRRARLSREAESRLLSFVQQTLSAIPVVQAFSTEDRNERQFRSLAGDAVALSQRGVLINSTYGLVNGLILSFGMAVVLFQGGLRVLGGTLSLGSLIVFLNYIRSMQMSMEGLLRTYSKLKPVEASIDRVLEILEMPESVPETPAPRRLPVPNSVQGPNVRFEGVTFGYESGRPVLRDINAEAYPGETVAVVGPSGAGKTTLLSLLPRLMDPWEGRILLDGVDIREFSLKELRSQVAIVLQESLLLPCSVAENIAYGRPDASREDIVRAAAAANAHEFIGDLPRGYDTILEHRGTNLSGGQRQRLAIARALLKDAPLLVLDEPTSALDATTEASVMEAIDRLRRGRTTFLIAHRLSTAKKADRIVVLEEGRVVESGTRGDLLATRGVFHRLYTLQFLDSNREVVA